MSERDVVLAASAVVVALTSTSPDAVSLRRQLVGSTTHAPHLIDAEVGSALRGRSLGGHLPDGVVPELLDDAAALVEHRYSHHGALALAAWRLRRNATFYDALYVALAASLDATLVTADARLAKAPGLPCRVQVLDDAPRA